MNDLLIGLGEAEARKALIALMARLRSLKDYSRQPDRPRTGSSLAADDAEFTFTATSHLVHSGLSAAQEHLLAVAFIWKSHEGGTLMPQAYGTLTRAAVVGAANAIHLLSPASREERVRRTIVLAHENFLNQLKADREALDSVSSLGTVERSLIHAQRESIARGEAQLAEIRAAWQRATGIASTKVPKYDQTGAVAEAYRAASRGEPTLEALGRHYWRSMSGDAHGLIWQKVLRSISTGMRDELVDHGDGTVHLTDVHTHASLLPIVGTATRLYDAASRLWAMRATVPPCGASWDRTRRRD